MAVGDAPPKKTLNVFFYNTKDNEKRLTHCVPIGDADCFKDDNLNNTTMKDVRQLLIDRKALTLSRFGCSFCTAGGAQIGDKTLFIEYQDLTGVGAEKPKDEGGDGEVQSTGASKFTVYEIYLQEKRKKGDVDEDLIKEYGNKNRNHDLEKNRPNNLDRNGIEHLESKYDASKVMATSGGELPNPAEMSQKDWHAVTRNNSLMNGHRLVFTPGGSDANGKTVPVKFRRIERAPYSAFQIIPRTFELYEVSNDVAKDASEESEGTVSLRIPRFVVTDDSYVNVYETQTAVERSMAESSFSETEVEGSAGGGAFGYSAGLSAGFSQNQSKAMSEEEGKKNETMNITYNFPRVVLHLDSRSVSLTRECKADLKKIEESRDPAVLVDFHQRYGHFFATRVELGGRLFASETCEMMGTTKKEEAAKAMKVSASAAFKGPAFQASASASHEKQERTEGEQKAQNLTATIDWQAQGGNTLLCSNPPEWVPTVAPFTNWRVIKQEEVIPLGQFIGGIKDYEHIPELFYSIKAESTVSKFVDVKLGYVPYNIRDREAKGLWMSYESGADHMLTGMDRYLDEHNFNYVSNDEREKAASGVASRGVGPGNLKLAESGSTFTWQVEIETNMGAEAKFEYNKWYRLYNKERNRYLSAQVIGGDEWRYTTFCHSERAKATFFKFEHRDQKRGSVSTGDKGVVEAFSASKEELGRLCVPKDRQGGILLNVTADYTLPDELWDCYFQFEVS